MSKQLFKNVFWSAYGVIINQVLSFVTLLILIRYLTPSDFGLVNMVIIIASFANVISDFGFGQALIQNKETSQIDYSSVFWFNILVGVVISIILFFSSGIISSIYGQTELNLITKVLSIKYIFSSTIIVQKIWIQKNLNFKLNSNIDILITLLTSIATIFALYMGLGYWSLVIQTISESFFAMIFFAIMVKWAPSFHFSLKSLKKLYKFSFDVFLNQSLFYWTANTDKILIGKYLGDNALGIYKNAFSVINRPISVMSSTLLRVLFPSYSLLQDNIPELRSIVLRLTKIISILIIPSCIILYLGSEFLITNYLKPEWGESIALVKIFSIAAIPFALSSITGPVYLALGKSRLILTINMVTRGLLLIFIVLFIKSGLIAIAYIILVTNFVRFVIDIIQFRRLLQIELDIIKIKIVAENVYGILLFIAIIGFSIFLNIDSLIKLGLMIGSFYSLALLSILHNILKIKNHNANMFN